MIHVFARYSVLILHCQLTDILKMKVKHTIGEFTVKVSGGFVMFRLVII